MPNEEGGSHPAPQTAMRELAKRLCSTSIPYDGDNGIGDGSNGGKDDSGDSGGKFASVTKLRL
jgi:hypothetical protein